jgi:hypothetical protein
MFLNLYFEFRNTYTGVSEIPVLILINVTLLLKKFK